MGTRQKYISRRLFIRPLNLNDFNVWVQSQELSKPKQNRFDTDPVPEKKRTINFLKKNVFRQRLEAKEDESYNWNLFVKKTGELIGWIHVSTISRTPYQMAEIGWIILNPYRRHGFAREALKKLIPMIFADLKFHRLEASIDTDNKVSIRFAKNLGLYQEGIKKHYFLQNGKWDDQMIFIATPELFKKF